MKEMRTNSYFSLKRVGMIVSLLIISALLLPSCNKEEEPKGDPSFSIEGDPTGMTATKSAKTQSFVVRSNRPWQIVAKSEADWVKVFPDKGDEDGIFKMIVSENQTFDPRTVNYAFVVDGVEQPVLFRVDQEANVPYITVPALVTVPAAGGAVTVNVTSNVAWTYTLADGSWLTEQSVTSTKVILSAAINNNPVRSTTMTVTATDFPTVFQTVTLTQSPGSVVLEENFSWLNYGSPIFYNTTGETRYDLWTQAEKDRGWTSTVNTVTGSGTTPLLYARKGFVRQLTAET
jgi:hypothetical protein